MMRIVCHPAMKLSQIRSALYSLASLRGQRDEHRVEELEAGELFIGIEGGYLDAGASACGSDSNTSLPPHASMRGTKDDEPFRRTIVRFVRWKLGWLVSVGNSSGGYRLQGTISNRTRPTDRYTLLRR
jgi:hypothetical protein